jgi:hypothetical protein
MDVRWISRDELLSKATSDPSLLVVVPDGESRAVDKMVKTLEKVNGEMANEGYNFSLDVKGSGDGLPVFFMKEADYVPPGAPPSGLISIVPLGLAGKVQTAPLEGAASFNREAIKWTSLKLWQLRSGNIDALEKTKEEFEVA